MFGKKVWLAALAGTLLLCNAPLRGVDISVDGGPTDIGFNSGTFAYIHATVRGPTGAPKRYVVFADIQYYGTTASARVELDRQAESKPGVEEFQSGWPIPPEAPTGLYTVSLHVEDRIGHVPGITKKAHGFMVYKKLVRISRVTIDKSVYNVGEPIKCEVALENLSDTEIKDLRVEFSNANYPWISAYSPGGKDSPDLAIRVLRDHLDLPAGNALTIPMMNAGTAALLAGQQRAMMGSGIGPINAQIPPPEIDFYTVALWNAGRTRLYDMQFTSQAVVRAAGRDLPIPYSRDYTHPYNSEIDFSKYREFYAPGRLSPVVRMDQSHTLYRPGDTVKIAASLTNPGEEAWSGASLVARITDSKGGEVYAGTLASGLNLAGGGTQKVAADCWGIPRQTTGTFSVELTVAEKGGKILGRTTTEIAANELPASLLVAFAHPDDERAYGGLIRAAVEAGIPIQILMLTGGDVGECERYFEKPCAPNDAYEFAKVRMEETAEALEHLGVSRHQFIKLGLPDGGLGKIWFAHRDSSNPFLSIYLACDHAPYENIYKPNLPYARDAVIAEIRQIVANFHPAMIALSHPDERHVDHRTSNWLVIKACQELLKSKELAPQTIVLGDQVYGAGGYKPAPYRYESFVIHLSGEAATLKQEMSWIYQSQDGDLDEGARQTLAELPREERHLRITDWQGHEGWNEQELNH